MGGAARAAIDKRLLKTSRYLQPVKRRRALLANNPLRNNRSKTHRNGEGAAKLPPFFSFIAAKDLPMPQKTQPNDRVKTFHQGSVPWILLARPDQGSPPRILRWADPTSHLFDPVTDGP
jgi:hypothetical protein